MKPAYLFVLSTCTALLVITGCKDAGKKTETTPEEPVIKEENITYTGEGVTMNGYVVYDESKEGPRPAIVVIPEWWGLNDYIKSRARKLAELGYIAMAMDMYGEGRTADNPDSAGKLAMPFYYNPQMARARFAAALAKLKSYPQADSSKLAAIGYCFGGGMVLNFARMGEDLDGVVSFHGTLLGTPAVKDQLKAGILVCHGAADPLVPQTEVDQFKKQMDSIGARYTFKAYESATHAFTNPNATAMGQKFNMPISYNAAADSASWNDMKGFFQTIFK